MASALPRTSALRMMMSSFELAGADLVEERVQVDGLGVCLLLGGFAGAAALFHLLAGNALIGDDLHAVPGFGHGPRGP